MPPPPGCGPAASTLFACTFCLAQVVCYGRCATEPVTGPCPPVELQTAATVPVVSDSDGSGNGVVGSHSRSNVQSNKHSSGASHGVPMRSKCACNDSMAYLNCGETRQHHPVHSTPLMGFARHAPGGRLNHTAWQCMESISMTRELYDTACREGRYRSPCKQLCLTVGRCVTKPLAL